MRNVVGYLLVAACALLAVSCSPRLPVEEIMSRYQANSQYATITIRYPQNETVFPPEIIAPTFVWQEETMRSDSWLIMFEFQGGYPKRYFTSRHMNWTPRPQEWEEIKQNSREKQARITVLGCQSVAPFKLLTRGQIVISTSKDAVDAPIFYREVNLPFIEAVKDPSRIRWRFGSISSLQPPAVVLEHLPVCGNCHSFSRDGQVLGMDVDYANNKGSYVITKVAPQMSLATSEIMTWSDYLKNDSQSTFGLLSQVSPDGQAVVSTVKDKSVFVEKPDLAFSQLFFPIKGILVVYHRNSGTFQPLPGADDPAYVQSNPSWSPDGKYIVFARSRAYQLKNPNAQSKLLLSTNDCEEFLKDGRPFLFDLYRIPYNGGRGGKPEPLAGASGNGRSNFFAKYSPDGQWIIFCQAKSYMLLQPDSELYIIPAGGGEARRLRCNTARMNSWHSWSPNSHWLVFSSKANSPYTQLFLTHIDDKGDSTPPIVLANFTAPDRAANIPEFVNAQAGAIVKIREQFLNDYSHARAAYVFEATGDLEKAITEYQKALDINPQNVHAHQRLGYLLFHVKRQTQAGLAHTMEALRLDPNDACAHYDLGMVLLDQEQLEGAMQHLAKAVELMPEGFDTRYNPADMRYSLATAMIAKGQVQAGTAMFGKAVDCDPKNAKVQYAYALALAAQGMIEESIKHYATAYSMRPDLDTMPELHDFLSLNYAKRGQFLEALQSAQRALTLAEAGGNRALAEALKDRIGEYRQSAR